MKMLGRLGWFGQCSCCNGTRCKRGVKQIEERQWRADEVRQAEQRWREHNANARANGCRCGAPSEVVTYEDGVTGSVPAETWTCREHQGVAVWSHRSGECWVPSWAHPKPCPLGMTTGTASKIGQPPYEWHCPHKMHEDERPLPTDD